MRYLLIQGKKNIGNAICRKKKSRNIFKKKHNQVVSIVRGVGLFFGGFLGGCGGGFWGGLVGESLWGF